MTTVEHGIIDAQVVDLPTPGPNRPRVLTAAGRRAAVRTGAELVRFGHGCAHATRELKDWRVATEYDLAVALAELAGDAGKVKELRAEQTKLAKERRAQLQAFVLRAIVTLVPVTFGGWAWATVTLGVALLSAFALQQAKAVAALVVQRLAGMFAISLLLQLILAAVGVHPAPVVIDPMSLGIVAVAPVAIWPTLSLGLVFGWKVKPMEAARFAFVAAVFTDGVYVGAHLRGLAWAWSPAYLLLPAVVLGPIAIWGVRWLWKATADDGTIVDDLRHGQASLTPSEPEARKGDPPVVDVINASEARLPKDAHLTLVAPGVAHVIPGKVWQAVIDTGGPTSQPIVDAVDDIASRLDLDESRCFIERQKGLGRRAVITGVMQDQFGPPSRSPLLDADTVNLLRDGLPWGTDWLCQRVTLQVAFRNFLIGGSPDAGKSKAGHPFHAGFALSPRSKLWIADGGRVDTAALNHHGLAHRWVANDPEGVRDLLRELNAEADRRQELLEEFGRANVGYGDKVSREFFDHYGIDVDLFWWDEFASHMRCEDTRLRKDIQVLSDSVLQRIRKLGIVAALATQSPSSIAMSTDGRDVISDRIALSCRTREMSDKITGGMAAEGINAKRLNPAEKRAWLSTAEGNRIVRADLLRDHDLDVIYRRAVALRAQAGTGAPRSEVPPLALAVREILRARELPSMRSAELVGRLRDAGHDLPDGIRGQQVLAAQLALPPLRLSSTALRVDGNRAHYVLTDVEDAIQRASSGASTPLLRIV